MFSLLSGSLAYLLGFRLGYRKRLDDERFERLFHDEDSICDDNFEKEYFKDDYG